MASTGARMRVAALHTASARPAGGVRVTTARGQRALCVAARSALQQAGYAEVAALQDARVPIVTFTDPRTRIRCQKALFVAPCVLCMENHE